MILLFGEFSANISESFRLYLSCLFAMYTAEFVLNVTRRDLLGKKVKKLRSRGMIVGSVFGPSGNFNVCFGKSDFMRLYSRMTGTELIRINYDGGVLSAYIDQVQLHPVSREILNVSFREVNLGEEVESKVPLVLVGDENCPARKESGLLVILTVNHLELRGKPEKIPSRIEIDVSNFKAGDVISVKDIRLAEGVELVHKDEQSLNRVLVTTTGGMESDREESQGVGSDSVTSNSVAQ